MVTNRFNPHPRDSRTLEALAFRFLGQTIELAIDHRKREQDSTWSAIVYPLPTGQVDGYTVFVIGPIEDSENYIGEIVAVLFDYGSIAGPVLVAAAEGMRPHRLQVLEQIGSEVDLAASSMRIFCLYDKSVGAVPYYLAGEGLRYLVIQSVLGHYCFPKGHIEAGERDEGTALREVWEETGLQVELQPGFRKSTSYMIRPGYKKEVLYFLGRFRSLDWRLQAEEVKAAELLPYESALLRLSYENDRNLLSEADAWLREKQHGV